VCIAYGIQNKWLWPVPITSLKQLIFEIKTRCFSVKCGKYNCR
jgi:hypothetical protein